MKKPIRNVLIVFLILVLGYGVARELIHHKITKILDEQVQKERLTYGDLSLNVLTGSAALDSLRFHIKSDTIFTDKLRVKGVGYWSYLFGNKLSVDKIILNHPKFALTSRSSSISSQKNQSFKSGFDKSIEIGEFALKKADLKWTEDTLTRLCLRDYSLQLNDIQATPEMLKSAMPFTYKSLQLQGGQLHYHLNQLQDIATDSIEINSHDILLHHVQVIPNYTETSYVKVIPYEKDLMKIDFSSLSIKDYHLDLQKSPVRFEAAKLILNQVDAHIFRNKTVRDDPRHKKLYSGMLRNLDFQLQVDSLLVNNTAITYREVQEKTKKTGKVFFKKMNVVASNLTNFVPEGSDFPKTKVDISCQFMGTSPLQVSWEFKVNDTTDNFRIYGHSKNIPPNAMNNFFIPAFNMKAKGTGVDQLAFDFNGDKKKAHGNFKMTYDKLKVEALDDNSGQKNEVFSFLANLFVDKKNEPEAGRVSVSDVKRDDTKSFWNYFWRCIFAGLKKTVVM